MWLPHYGVARTPQGWRWQGYFFRPESFPRCSSLLKDAGENHLNTVRALPVFFSWRLFYDRGNRAAAVMAGHPARAGTLSGRAPRELARNFVSRSTREG